MAKEKTVAVYCGLQGGLTLRTFERKETDPGITQAIPDLDMITLNYGENLDVDRVIIEKWLKQNHDNDVVRNGLVSIQEAQPTTEKGLEAASAQRADEQRAAAVETVTPGAPNLTESGAPADEEGLKTVASVSSGASPTTIENPAQAPADATGRMSLDPPQSPKPSASRKPKPHNKTTTK